MAEGKSLFREFPSREPRKETNRGLGQEDSTGDLKEVGAVPDGKALLCCWTGRTV